MPLAHQVIHIEVAAPPKPPQHSPCNGCGVCCLAEPCPLGMLLSRRRTGACVAVQWVAQDGLYRCGALTEPHALLVRTLPHGARWLATPLAWVMRKLGRRWIAAGRGCDSTLEVASQEQKT